MVIDRLIDCLPYLININEPIDNHNNDGNNKQPSLKDLSCRRNPSRHPLHLLCTISSPYLILPNLTLPKLTPPAPFIRPFISVLSMQIYTVPCIHTVHRTEHPSIPVPSMQIIA